MDIINYLLIFLNFFLYTIVIFLPNVKILQLENYNVKKLIKFNFKYRKYLIFNYIIPIIILIISFVIKNTDNKLILILQALLSVFYVVLLCKLKVKNNFPIFTKRVFELFVLFILLSITYTILSITLCYNILSVIFVTILYNILSIISHLIINLYNNIKLKRLLKLTSKKFNNSSAVKIGVVGSYAKTSVKNILHTILSEKYLVLSTPKSYNTPVGLALTIKKNDLSNYDVIILEMGADKIGDIKYLCNYFKPDYAILTAIGKQHLENFLNIDNIIKTKSEIFEFIDDNHPIVLNYDNEYIREIKVDKNIMAVGLNECADITAEIIYMDITQSKFKVFYKHRLLFTASTFLTGKHNVVNILLAVAIALELKLSISQIKNGISKLKSVESRMEKIILESGVTIINNGYNSNPNSAESSLEYIKLFKDKRKVIITPGFVEMGDDQYKLNYEFGQKIANDFDKCIIVNKINRRAIIEGLKSNGFTDFETVDKLKEVDFSKFNMYDVVLIENDLPANYV